MTRAAGLFLLCTAALLLGAVPARAESRAQSRAAAVAALKAIDAVPAHKLLAKDAVDRARSALERARGARGSGDPYHAELLEAAAREWAELGLDLVRAAGKEKDAESTERAAAELETKLVRARALLEETIARRGRAREKLEATGAPKSEPKAAPDPAPSKGKP